MAFLDVSSNDSVLDCNKNNGSYPSNACCIALDCLVKESYGNVDYDGYKARLRCSFEQLLAVFLKEINCRGIVRPVPVILGERGSLDLFALFVLVRDKGGYHVVSEKELWSLVVVELGLDRELSASVKLIYSKYLSELEKCLMMRCGGRKLENGNSDYHFEESFRFPSELEGNLKGMLYGVLGQKRVHDECSKFESSRPTGKVNIAAVEKETKFTKTIKVQCKLDGDVTQSPPKNGDALHDDGENGRVDVNEDGKTLDSVNVESEIKSHDRNRKFLQRMLTWVRQRAKHPGNPSNATIPEPSKWKDYVGSSALWIQVVRAKDALLIRNDVGANSERRTLQKKVKMHPSIYEDNIDNHHLSTERIRCSKRRTSSVKSVLVSCNNSCSTIQNNMIGSPKAEIEKDLEKKAFSNEDLKPTSGEICPDEDSVEKLVPVGALFQAVIPEWTGKISESDSKWLGTQVWPFQYESNHLKPDINPIGRGRPDSCSCQIPGSVECVRFHIAEARMKLKLELGLAFYHWRFHHMGEEISLQWTTEEKERFKELVRSNFNSQSKCFWNYSLKWFPRKSRKNLISYYFNVFLLLQRSYQNRVTPNSIDSDDEEVEFGCISGDFGNKAVELLGTESLECAENKQCIESLECADNKQCTDIE